MKEHFAWSLQITLILWNVSQHSFCFTKKTIFNLKRAFFHTSRATKSAMFFAFWKICYTEDEANFYYFLSEDDATFGVQLLKIFDQKITRSCCLLNFVALSPNRSQFSATIKKAIKIFPLIDLIGITTHPHLYPDLTKLSI